VELWRISRTYVLLNGHARARYDVGSLSLNNFRKIYAYG
jgi:hypothetical protein